MKQLALILIVLTLTGCASPRIVTIDKPAVYAPPPPCEKIVSGKCKAMTAQEKSGATSLGYKDDEENVPKAAAVPP